MMPRESRAVKDQAMLYPFACVHLICILSISGRHRMCGAVVSQHYKLYFHLQSASSTEYGVSTDWHSVVCHLSTDFLRSLQSL